jgi:hypothetical protein
MQPGRGTPHQAKRVTLHGGPWDVLTGRPLARG